ncbi:hypothetical protein M115_1710 [Bacteroides fragilis str. 3719 T6]|nr:hypothetical protein M085_1584 [Bacteroides fragilis str. 3986 N(B)19]EYA48684.1 hypothetical protein M115_1710 [Bacteroides fragilis str. 3719 T6]
MFHSFLLTIKDESAVTHVTHVTHLHAVPTFWKHYVHSQILIRSCIFKCK